MSEITCRHVTITWAPAEVTYDCNGEAEVWQPGICDDCGKSFSVEYVRDSFLEQLDGE